MDELVAAGYADLLLKHLGDAQLVSPTGSAILPVDRPGLPADPVRSRRQTVESCSSVDTGVTVDSCRLCGGRQRRVLFTTRDRFERSDDEYAIVACETCALVAITPQPKPEDRERLYPDHYYSYRPAPPRRRPLWRSVGSLREYSKLRGRPLPVGARVLEVGCGSGASLDWHLQLGRECHGVEISPQAVALGGTRGIRMHLGELEDAGFEDGYFDLVIGSQVFEHVRDPVRCLREMHRILRPEGRLLLSVPNHASLNRRVFGRHWIGYDVPRHCHSFTPATLRSFLEQSNFRCIAIDHVAGHYTLAASIGLAASAGRDPGATRAAVDRLAGALWMRLACLPVALATDLLRMSDVVRVLAERE